MTRGSAGNETVDVRHRPDITIERNGACTSLCQLVDGGIRPVRKNVSHSHSRAGRSKRTRNRASDAFAPAPDHQGAHAVEWLCEVIHNLILPHGWRTTWSNNPPRAGNPGDVSPLTLMAGSLGSSR